MTQPTYNFIFSQLVQDRDDLVGLIAYGIYKQEKIEFIAKVKAEQGIEPGNDQIKAFNLSSNTDGRLQAYRGQAEQLMLRFSQEMLEDQASSLQSAYNDQLIKELKEAQPFWRGVWQNVWANLFAFALTALLVVIVWGSKVGIVKLIELIFGVQITESN